MTVLLCSHTRCLHHRFGYPLGCLDQFQAARPVSHNRMIHLHQLLAHLEIAALRKLRLYYIFCYSGSQVPKPISRARR